MHKVAVVGDRDSILAFKALGVEVVHAAQPEDARRAIDTLARDKYGVIFVTEQVAADIPDTIERYNKILTPAVILIPSNQGTLNIGMKRISDNVEKAVGSNIL
ncbi:V-type ATP synthase subunit F [Clostridiaceae bacterium JG1575]|nr:V-type ATP synthase subunit F [Clostridiaceae bacterium JG1575]